MKYLTIASCVAVGLSAQIGTAEALENSAPPITVSQPQPPRPETPESPAVLDTIQKQINAASVRKTRGKTRQGQPDGPEDIADPISPDGDFAPPPPPRPVGPLAPLGTYLNDHGVQVGVFVDNFFLRQITTGLVPNQNMNSGDIKTHIGLDLEKIIGVPKTRLNFDETFYMLSYQAFDFVKYSNSYFFPGAGGAKPTMLSRLTIETDLFNDRLHIEVGRMNPIFNFMTPLYCGACFNGTQARNANFPGPDAQAWGGRAAYKLTPHDTIQGGLYENDLYIFQNTNGWDFSTKNATGYIAAANFVHETTFMDDTHPVKFEIGMYHNSELNTDPLYNTDGSSHILNPLGTALQHGGGITGGFAQFRKVVWSPEGSLGNPFAQNIAVYGAAFLAPGAGISYPVEGLIGVEWSNFIPNQPFWMVGLGLHYAMVGDEKALFEQQMRTLLGGPNVATKQHMFSPTAVLRFPITQFVIAQPYAFYFINQDQSYIPSAKIQKDGWFIGVRATLNFGGALGLSAGGPPL
jgi:porin